jgi:uncharacterized protein (TIGR02145 family)
MKIILSVIFLLLCIIEGFTQNHSQVKNYAIESKQQEQNTFTDNRDSCIYKTITIGNQTWMAENLHYKTPAGSWCYYNDTNNCNRYGRLYTYEMAAGSCPSGWHLPTKAEWDTLVNYLGGTEVAGSKLKSKSFWFSKHDSISSYAHVTDCLHKDPGNKHDSILINSSSFNGMAGGGRYAGEIFDYKGEYGIWWSATGYNEYNSYYFSLYDTSTEAGNLLYALNSTGFSVRCLKNK